MDENTLKGKLSEQYINELSFNSFIKYWCYPNPKDEDGDKKEICDLLVLFKNYCIIFQIKDIKTYEGYDKFEKHAITPGINQLNGAERKLFTQDRTMYIKHPDREKENFQKDKYDKIIRILIIMNEDLEYRKWIGENKLKETIHILDKESFERIITELDTISDFSRYFFDKEQFINKYKNISLFGTEIDLLAFYLKNQRKFPEIDEEKVDTVMLELDGDWVEYIQSNEYYLKKEADKTSYFVDDLVRDYILLLPDGEKFANEILSLDRLQRRFFSDKYKEFWDQIDFNQQNYNCKKKLSINETTYIFFYVSSDIPDNCTEYLMNVLSNSFNIYNEYENKKTIVMTSSKNRHFFKLSLEETQNYPNDYEKQTMDKAKALNWFTNLKFSNETIKEYPDNKSNYYD